MFTTYQCVVCGQMVSWADRESHTHHPVKKFIRFHVDTLSGVAGLVKPVSSLLFQINKEAKRGQRWEDQDRFMKRHAIPISLSTAGAVLGSFALSNIFKKFGIDGGVIGAQWLKFKDLKIKAPQPPPQSQPPPPPQSRPSWPQGFL